MKYKSSYVLGINEALCASAALLKDGQIIAAAAEERFSRIKNHWGFPKRAIKFCLKQAGIRAKQLNLVVLSYTDPYPHFVTENACEVADSTPQILISARNLAPQLEYRFPWLNLITNWGRKLYYNYYLPKNQQLQLAQISQALKISPLKIIRLNHHLCHAYSAYYANPQKQNPTLVFTLDGAGDQQSATIYQVINNQFELIAKTAHTASIGLLYASVTSFLGLKAHEDEYKIMGLAPYADNSDTRKIYQIFADLINVDGLVFKAKIPSRLFGFYLHEKLTGFRFDHIASALQKFLEDSLVLWIKNGINHTQIHDLALSGGVFLNVKANQQIANLKTVKSAFFMPSAGDDSNAIGACYYGYQQLNQMLPQTLTSLYLGPSYSAREISRALTKYPQLKISRPKNLAKTIALLLARGEIVARFADRMEFGARALGNRSILADPRKPQLIEKINQSIKKRDFWMPFAATILDQDAEKYLINPKHLPAQFMILAFDTTDSGNKVLAAAIHPYDKTCRPQILTKQTNPRYYQIIEEFKKLTGVGAVLNTSFNLHGEPIVCSPQDALQTFIQSGLKYLVIDRWLVAKNRA